MPTRIRLQRYGKKHKPFYHIVIADGRAPRDGRFIETIGTYNPLTNPADIVLDFDKALDWLQKGAQPSDSVRAILSYKGVLYKNHLLKGVKKGAFSEEQAEAKFDAWLKDKNAKIDKKRSEHLLGIRESQKQRLAEEAKINEEKAKQVAKKRADQLEKQVEETQAGVPEQETEGQDDEVRTPKELELKEAIEEKAKAKEKEAGAGAGAAEEEEKEAGAGAAAEEKEDEEKEAAAGAGAAAAEEEKEEERKEAGAGAAEEERKEAEAGEAAEDKVEEEK